MKVLLIGKDGITERLFSKLGQGHAITHCADGARALAELRNGSSQYDWIVVQGMARTLSSMEIASTIRAMGVWAPIAFLCDADHIDHVQQQGAPKSTVPNSGFLPQALAARWTHAAIGKTAELLFEYHAPIKRRGHSY